MEDEILKGLGVFNISTRFELKAMNLLTKRHYLATLLLVIIPTTVCKETSLHICNIINRRTHVLKFKKV